MVPDGEKKIPAVDLGESSERRNQLQAVQIQCRMLQSTPRVTLILKCYLVVWLIHEAYFC
jgi:hypothetical protein